jgi:hypothetical protein
LQRRALQGSPRKPYTVGGDAAIQGRVARFFSVQYTKTGKKQNDNKIYERAIK